MTKDEALRLAEEALAEIHPGNMTPMAEKSWNKALAAIRAALVDTVDTTEKCVDETVKCGHEPVMMMNLVGNTQAYMPGQQSFGFTIPLYAAPVEPVKQEPVAWMLECPTMAGGTGWKLSWTQSGAGACNRLHGVEHEKPLYTTPQPRQDVDLTDDDIYELWVSPIYCDDYVKFARAVIAKYKDKNSA